MSEEVKDKMLEVAKILFKNNVPIEQAKFIGDFIETQNNKLQQKENIIKKVREYIKENTQWYDKELGLVEMEGYETDRIPVIYKYGLLEILDKENI